MFYSFMTLHNFVLILLKKISFARMLSKKNSAQSHLYLPQMEGAILTFLIMYILIVMYFFIKGYMRWHTRDNSMSIFYVSLNRVPSTWSTYH